MDLENFSFKCSKIAKNASYLLCIYFLLSNQSTRKVHSTCLANTKTLYLSINYCSKTPNGETRHRGGGYCKGWPQFLGKQFQLITVLTKKLSLSCPVFANNWQNLAVLDRVLE